MMYLWPLMIGAVSALGFAPFSLPPVLVGAYAWLFARLSRDGTTRAQGFWMSYAFGFGQLLVGLYWIGESTLIDFATWWWAWPFTTFGLPIGLGLYYGIAGYCTMRFPRARLVAAAVFFGLAEMARAFLFTGFPWNLAGTTWINIPWIAQNADWAGVYGLTCITIALAALFAHPTRYRWVGLGAAIIIVMAAYGGIIRGPTTYDPNVLVRIIQPNIAQGDKWDTDQVFSNSLTPLEMTGTPPQGSTAKEHWIIWPETAQVSRVWNSPEFQKFYTSMMGAWPDNTRLYTGYLSLEQDNLANMILSANKKAEIDWTQNKYHLVPFGEYMPFDEWLGVGPIVGITGFVIKNPPQTMGDGVIPLICYEIIFPELARRAITSNSRAIITVTDDSWFGTGSGPRQHLVQVRFRAIETGLPVLRSANTGISTIIDAYGRTIIQSKMNITASIDSSLPERRNNATLYSIIGDLFTLIYFGIGASILFLSNRQKLFY